MARLKRHHFRNPPPISSGDEISDSAAAEDNSMHGGAHSHSPARTLSDSDIEGTPPSPSLSGFIVEPIRPAFAGEDSAAKPNRSSARSGSKRLSEQDGGEVKTRKKKKKSSSSAAAATVSPTPVAGGGDQEIKKSSGAVQRIWSEEDEIAILEGVIEYRVRTGSEPSGDAVAFLEFMRDSIHVEASKTQLMDKVRSLKKKFRVKWLKCEKGEDPVFSKSHDSTVFELSKEIWGKPESNEETMIHNNASGSRKRAKPERSDKKTVVPESVTETPLTLGLPKQDANAKKSKKLANGESENGVEPAKRKGDFEYLADAAVAAAAAEANSNPEVVDDRVEVVGEKGPDGKENGGSGEAKWNPPEVVDGRTEMVVEKRNGDSSGAKCNPEVVDVRTEMVVVKGNGESRDTDSNWGRYPYLQDALERLVSQGVMGDFEKKLLHEKVGFLEGDKRKEWDDEWKAIRFEEMQLDSKRHRLLAEFSEAVLEELKK